MRFKVDIRHIGGGLVIPLLVSLLASEAWARTEKYKRTQSKDQVSDTVGIKPGTQPEGKTSENKPADSGVPKAPEKTGEKKVDLTDLENRYWTAKDTEFSVVQNRLYTKDKKFALTLFTGPLLSDPYTTSWNYGGALNYYFSERHGVELHGWTTSGVDNDVVSNFGNRFGAYPDHNMPRGYIGAAYNWIPVYAKLSLLEKKILYFDLSISPGLGVTMLDAATYAIPTNGFAKPNVNSTMPLTLSLDIAEQVFINEHWAIRIDFRNHVYQEKIYKSDLGTEIRNKTTYYGTVLLGVTFFQ